MATRPGTLFARGAHGFMVLDFLRSGRITLRVYALDPDAGLAVAYGIDLLSAPER